MGSKKTQENGGPPGSSGRVSVRAVSFAMGALTFCAEVLLAGSLGLVLFWVFRYHGGVAWSDDGSRQMNLHYVLMIGGFTFLSGHSILVYRLFPCCRKLASKLVHTIIFTAAAACAAIGLYAAIDAHSDGPNSVHFYSLHSWIGLTACGLFALQFVAGFFTFLVLMCCEAGTARFREAMLPAHVTIGLATFCIAAVASLTGLMQSARYRLSGKDGKPNYKDFPEQGIVLNVLGLCLVALLIVIPYLVRNSPGRRAGTLTIN